MKGTKKNNKEKGKGRIIRMSRGWRTDKGKGERVSIKEWFSMSDASESSWVMRHMKRA